MGGGGITEGGGGITDVIVRSPRASSLARATL
jgi:hypothetical protein